MVLTVLAKYGGANTLTFWKALCGRDKMLSTTSGYHAHFVYKSNFTRISHSQNLISHEENRDFTLVGLACWNSLLSAKA